MTIKVGPTGLEISRIAAAAAAIAADAAVRADQHTPLDQDTLASNLAVGIESSLELARRPGRNLKILWVDDNPQNNKYLLEAFRDIGITVLEALTTEQALQKLQSERFSLIITDMSRPPDNEAGLTLLNHVEPGRQYTPIIIYASKWASDHLGEEIRFKVSLITDDPSMVYSAVMKSLNTQR